MYIYLKHNSLRLLIPYLWCLTYWFTFFFVYLSLKNLFLPLLPLLLPLWSLKSLLENSINSQFITYWLSSHQRRWMTALLFRPGSCFSSSPHKFWFPSSIGSPSAGTEDKNTILFISPELYSISSILPASTLSQIICLDN